VAVSLVRRKEGKEGGGRRTVESALDEVPRHLPQLLDRLGSKLTRRCEVILLSQLLRLTPLNLVERLFWSFGERRLLVKDVFLAGALSMAGQYGAEERGRRRRTD
jgi:hypothetical protein